MPKGDIAHLQYHQQCFVRRRGVNQAETLPRIIKYGWWLTTRPRVAIQGCDTMRDLSEVVIDPGWLLAPLAATDRFEFEVVAQTNWWRCAPALDEPVVLVAPSTADGAPACYGPRVIFWKPVRTCDTGGDAKPARIIFTDPRTPVGDRPLPPLLKNQRSVESA